MSEVYDDIRPFYDSEVKAAIEDLQKEPEFSIFVNYLFSETDRPAFYEKLGSINTVKEFQGLFAKSALRVILKRTANSFTFSGLENVDRTGVYLFMSNHRDIVLDSGLINLVLFEHEHETCELAIGSNLLITEFIRILVRLNKSFRVTRGGSTRDTYDASKRLSNYIQHTLHNKKTSVWIAQREGRAKDGDDRTMPGLLRMLMMSSEGDNIQFFNRLKLVPVSISYEFDPCDWLKCVELYHKSEDIPFEKTPEKDIESMLTGFQGYKGNIHLHFGNPIEVPASEVPQPASLSDWLRQVAGQIDQIIHLNYQLWPINYVSADLFEESGRFSGAYSAEQKNEAVAYIGSRLDKMPDGYDRDKLRNIFLRMYANPAINKMAAKE